MATNVTVIGRTTRVRGRVTGAVDLEIQGFVEGEIAVGGNVTVAAQGIVGAGIRGRRLVVHGAVKGDLVGDESIVLEAGARVVGDLRAPRVAIAPGALVRGYVQTESGDQAEPHASRAQVAARPALVQPAPRAVAPPIARAVPATPSSAVAVLPVSRQPAAAAPPAKSAPKPLPPVASPRRPPPPVVPALRGAKGQIAKKKER